LTVCNILTTHNSIHWLSSIRESLHYSKREIIGMTVSLYAAAIKTVWIRSSTGVRCL